MSNRIEPACVFVVIPAYNEAKIINQVVAGLLKQGYHLVVVDDGSDPQLPLSLQDERLFLLRHEVNLGQGAAIQTGIEFALEKQAGYVVTFDADGQHDPGDVKLLIETLTHRQVDIVLGSRFLRPIPNQIPAGRKMVLQLARYLNFLLTGLLLTDAHNGLRAMTSAAAKKIRIRENRMAHASEILSEIRRNQLHYAEVPVHVHYTAYSRQKGQTVWHGFRIVFDLLLNKIFR